MKTRKSTAVLLSVWVATLVLYVFVKPPTTEQTGFTKIADTVSKASLTSDHGH
ncbi:hypothetical protein [Nocardia vermiculata]|uniref:Uncharacterized protein n=1 Tax=Nocardia vermiculata TaxID=257274 RepID=A0A846Y146_9NOCA|nr:hypothetical protein [Nocardia vermiculata]NKY51875.1 hypothetical protein [Nocardia vermiculata]